jgi:hypothetical protein
LVGTAHPEGPPLSVEAFGQQPVPHGVAFGPQVAPPLLLPVPPLLLPVEPPLLPVPPPLLLVPPPLLLAPPLLLPKLGMPPSPFQGDAASPPAPVAVKVQPVVALAARRPQTVNARTTATAWARMALLSLLPKRPFSRGEGGLSNHDGRREAGLRRDSGRDWGPALGPEVGVASFEASATIFVAAAARAPFCWRVAWSTTA